MIRYTNYEQKYEGQVVDLWNRSCLADPIHVDKFRKQALFDENFDENLALVAIDEIDTDTEKSETVVGFILGMRRKFPYLERGLEPEKGWISVLFVDPAYRRQGIGTKMVDTIETQLKEAGAKRIILAAYSPNYFFGGLDPDHYKAAWEFFCHRGYQPGALHYSMGRDLHGYQIRPETLQKKKEAEKNGFRFLPFDWSYSLELLKFLRDEFGGGWKRDALMAMQKGLAPDRIQLVIGPEGNIVGCCNRAIDDNPMRFGPVGIGAAGRNHGLGTILLEEQLYDMAKRGIYRMYFMTTDEAGRRYYERAGLSVIRKLQEFDKEI